MAKIDASGNVRVMEMWLLPFAAMFTQPSWLNAGALATGALLCLNRRTVCAALRAVDGAADKGFSRFHRFLSRADWSGLQGARILLGLLQTAFVPEGEPLVIAVDDSVERRRGAMIRDKGIYRDAVRSSRGFFVKVAGLRWLSLQVVTRPGFARRTGVAVPDGSEPLGTGRCQAAAPTPDAAGEGDLGHAAGRPLVPGPTAGDGRRRRLRQPGPLLDTARLRGVRGALPHGRTLLQPAAATPERPERQVARRRHPATDAAHAGGAEGHEVGAHDRAGVADEGWEGGAGGRCRDRHGAVERARQDHAGALGPDQGPGWTRRDARLRLLRSGAVSVADPDMVRDALGGRAYFPRGPAPPRVRDPAPVVGSGDPPKHAVAAQPVLAGDAVGRRHGRADRPTRGARRCLVQKAGPNVRGLPRRR
ncbi:protein of unknown function (plasmid) [Rhodovastum atsumiense]|nr:protein of unknown function [Rhodovastum atsumiense]